MLPAVVKELGPELTAYFILRVAYRHISVAHYNANMRLNHMKLHLLCCSEGRDLASSQTNVAQQDEIIRYPEKS